MVRQAFPFLIRDSFSCNSIHRGQFWLFIGIVLSVVSCERKQAIDFERIDTHSREDLASISFFNSNEGLAVAGATWRKTDLLITRNGGESWSSDSIYNKKIFGLSRPVQNAMYGAGIDRFWKFGPDGTFELSPPGEYRFYRSVDANDKGFCLAAGGEAFRIGYVDLWNGKDSTKRVYEGVNELDAVAWVKEDVFVAAGFGLAVRTKNLGQSWDTMDVSGDHYLDVYKVNNGPVYMLGAQGSVWKSNEEGEQWQQMRKADVFATRRHRALCFADAQNGIIVGDDALLEVTRDGGEHWSSLNTIDENVDFSCCSYSQGYYFVGGQNGLMIKFKAP